MADVHLGIVDYTARTVFVRWKVEIFIDKLIGQATRRHCDAIYIDLRTSERSLGLSIVIAFIERLSKSTQPVVSN